MNRFDPVIRDTQKHAQEMGEIEQYEFQQEAVMKRAKEIAAEMITADGFDDNGVTYNLGDVTEHIYSDDSDVDAFHRSLAGLLDPERKEAAEIFMQSILMKHATAVAEDIAWREAG